MRFNFIQEHSQKAPTTFTWWRVIDVDVMVVRVDWFLHERFIELHAVDDDVVLKFLQTGLRGIVAVAVQHSVTRQIHSSRSQQGVYFSSAEKTQNFQFQIRIISTAIHHTRKANAEGVIQWKQAYSWNSSTLILQLTVDWLIDRLIHI